MCVCVCVCVCVCREVNFSEVLYRIAEAAATETGIDMCS
jgi:hypothetical protein